MNIDKLLKKLDTVEDEELKSLVLELINERDELNTSVYKDELTGVYNRRILSHIKDDGIVAICDIDGFKSMNDEFGHDHGDIVLKEFASNLISSTRSDDIVCRYGGDEFVVFFKGCPMEVAKRRLEELKTKLDNIPFSAGLVEHTTSKTIEESIELADKALYNAKEIGKNKIIIYNEK